MHIAHERTLSRTHYKWWRDDRRSLTYSQFTPCTERGREKKKLINGSLQFSLNRQLAFKRLALYRCLHYHYQCAKILSSLWARQRCLHPGTIKRYSIVARHYTIELHSSLNYGRFLKLSSWTAESSLVNV